MISNERMRMQIVSICLPSKIGDNGTKSCILIKWHKIDPQDPKFISQTNFIQYINGSNLLEKCYILVVGDNDPEYSKEIVWNRQSSPDRIPSVNYRS